MVDSSKNYTPISVSGARPRGSFFGTYKPKNVLVIGGLLAMMVLAGVGAVALRNSQTITTPAQTVPRSCPAGYDQVGVGTPSAEELNRICPSGDAIFVNSSSVVNATPNPGTAGGGTTGGDGSTTNPGGGDDVTGTNTPIICCRMLTPTPTPENSPTPSPTPTTPEKTPTPSPTPFDDGVPTPPDDDNSCVVPELNIIDVTLDCPNCEQ